MPGMEQIRWKDLPGTPYRVSENGDVMRGSKTLKWTVGSGGYAQVSLSLDGRETKARVHRLVAILFIGPPPSEEHQANHKDWNKLNNRVDNLEWTTPKENTKHALTRPGAMEGRFSKFRKLSLGQVRAARERAMSGESYASIARSMGVQPATIGKAVRGVMWSWVDPAKIAPPPARGVRQDARGRFCA